MVYRLPLYCYFIFLRSFFTAISLSYFLIFLSFFSFKKKSNFIFFIFSLPLSLKLVCLSSCKQCKLYCNHSHTQKLEECFFAICCFILYLHCSTERWYDSFIIIISFLFHYNFSCEVCFLHKQKCMIIRSLFQNEFLDEK